jgi:NAD+ synthase (glutamine-hydrolysing)
VKIALAQTNSVVGDLDGNRARCGRFVDEALRRKAQIVVFPELSLAGYPPRDLLTRDRFVAQNRAALMTFAASVYKIGVVIGFIDHDPNPRDGRGIYDAVATVKNGQIISIHHKSLLLPCDAHDEPNRFSAAQRVRGVIFDGRTLGITIGEDIWDAETYGPPPPDREPPLAKLIEAGADVLIHLAARPFVVAERQRRVALLADVARAWERPLVHVNQVGGNDELVFAGRSLALGADGEVLARAREFAEDLVVVDIESDTGEIHDLQPSDDAALFEALALGVKDHVQKCGFQGVVIGLSGGIDSSLVAAVAVRALGPGNVLGVAMPSRFSSPESEEDARALAQRLGINYDVIPIDAGFDAMLESLAGIFGGAAPDVAEENLQARLRALILMGVANKLGRLLLSTGNRSEIMTGYCTLYGDMAGSLAVIGDLPKTLVYQVAAEVNRDREVIPARIMTKPPSAELKPGQRDQDSLPPYDVLDAILEAFVDRGLDEMALIAAGFERDVVREVLRLVASSEHKRRQGAPVLHVRTPILGRRRRMPVASRWRG